MLRKIGSKIELDYEMWSADAGVREQEEKEERQEGKERSEERKGVWRQGLKAVHQDTTKETRQVLEGERDARERS